MNSRIKLAVVDDQLLFRMGLISLLEEHEDFEMVMEAENGKDLFKKMKNQAPEVVLLDIEMPIMDGIKTVEKLGKNYPQIKILILSMYNDEELIIHMIERGAHGFLLKNNSIGTIIKAIHAVVKNDYFFNDHISENLVNRIRKNYKNYLDFPVSDLSLRELEVIRLICQEHTNREIAEMLCVSVRTIDGHRENILQKINAKNTAGIVMYAMKNKIAL